MLWFFITSVFASTPSQALDATGTGDLSDLVDPTQMPPLYWSDRLLLPGADGIVGGTPVTGNDWEDVAAVVFDNAYVGCTGTLIAPNLVLTAAHCADGITDVILDSKDYASDPGEAISVSQIWVHPSYDGWYGYDIALLRLSRDSTRTPRVIATDCIRDEYLQDGAPVTAVGYGATNIQGTQYGSKLREGTTDIDDADCGGDYADGVYMGCDPGINPGGEIGAGGDGVDACFGDSGGPLFLLTPDGEAYLTGVTSRAYAGIDPNYPCRDGGIWVRADAVMGWIENVSGQTLERPQCNVPPEVHVEPLVLEAGTSKAVDVAVTDDGFGWTAQMVASPAHGSVRVDGSGTVWFDADAGYEGSDAFTVDIVDDGGDYGTPASTRVTVDVTVVAPGSAPLDDGEDHGGTSGDPSRHDDEDPPSVLGTDESPTATYQRIGRSCSTSPGTPGLLPLALLALLGLRRRHRV